LAARLTGWRIDIKSESQLAEEEAYAAQEWAEGEWVQSESGEMVWQPAGGGEALSAEQWEAGSVNADGEGGPDVEALAAGDVTPRDGAPEGGDEAPAAGTPVGASEVAATGEGAG
jgi:N utilization substance protein A